MLGKTVGYDFEEPFPVQVPGEDKPIPSSKIGDYIDAEFFHYYNFYTYTKHAGAPMSGGWLEYPEWIPQLLANFDNTFDVIKAHYEREAYKGINHGRSKS